MNLKSYLYIIILPILFGCQQTKKEIINNGTFKWTISLPLGFDHINAEEWIDYKKKGESSIINNSGLKITDQSKPIFVIQNGEFNRFDANYTLVENFIAPNSTFTKTFKKLNSILFDNFKNKLPNAKIDTIISTEIIDELEFQKFEMNTHIENDVIIRSIGYRRLFKEKVLSINIIYLDENKGNRIMKSLMSSKFK